MGAWCIKWEVTGGQWAARVGTLFGGDIVIKKKKV